MIKVRITGPAGSGKTLLTWLLRAQLRILGLNVHGTTDTAVYSVVGCADQLRRLNTVIAIIDSEDPEPK